MLLYQGIIEAARWRLLTRCLVMPSAKTHGCVVNSMRAGCVASSASVDEQIGLEDQHFRRVRLTGRFGSSALLLPS